MQRKTGQLPSEGLAQHRGDGSSAQGGCFEMGAGSAPPLAAGRKAEYGGRWVGRSTGRRWDNFLLCFVFQENGKMKSGIRMLYILEVERYERIISESGLENWPGLERCDWFLSSLWKGKRSRSKKRLKMDIGRDQRSKKQKQIVLKRGQLKAEKRKANEVHGGNSHEGKT